MLARLTTLARPSVMWAGGIVRSKDGSISLTKLGAATFHATLAFQVNWIQWHAAPGTFLIDMWLLYASFAVGHASLDKGIAVVKDFKDKTLELKREPAPPQAQ